MKKYNIDGVIYKGKTLTVIMQKWKMGGYGMFSKWEWIQIYKFSIELFEEQGIQVPEIYKEYLKDKTFTHKHFLNLLKYVGIDIRRIK